MKILLNGFTTLLASVLALTVLTSCKNAEDSAVIDVNYAPVANAGLDQAQTADAKVLLDGSASFDEDGDTLNYSWSFEYVPEGSSLGEGGADAFFPNGSNESVQTSFQPDAVGTYVVALKVNDTRLWSAPDFVVVRTETPETIPVADAGEDVIVNQGDSVCLDGSGSYDPSGMPLSYLWSLVAIPELSTLDSTGLQGADSSELCFTADARGVYTFSLQVSNGLTSSLSDGANVTSVGDNGEPVANAGEDKSGQDCSWHSLSGGGSVDPDGDTLSYFWELQSKPSDSDTASDTSFNPDRFASNPTFFADTAGVYVLSLTVFDGSNWSTPDLLVITVGERAFNNPPVVSIDTPDAIDAGEACCEPSGYVYDCDECTSQTTSLGDVVTINDPDNDPYTTKWEVIDGDVTFVDDSDVATNFKMDDIEPAEPQITEDNEFQLQLTVTDCTGEATVATVTQVVQCTGADETDTGIDCEAAEE